MPSQKIETVDHPDMPHELTLFDTILNKVLNQLLARGMGCGPLHITTPSGKCYSIACDENASPAAHLSIHKPWMFFWRLFFGWDVGFAESYMAGEWTSPNVVALLKLACSHSWGTTSIGGLRPPSLLLRLRHAFNKNSKSGSRRNIAAHYDLGNEFYAQWLDHGMSYSSALYRHSSQTLEDAQTEKQDRVLDLLDLSGKEKVLEIGFGWGGLAHRILSKSDCTLTGITLSTEQLSHARKRLQESKLNERGDLHLQDYRDVDGAYDRIVSIEMLEAVGQAYWPLFFSKLRRSLKPDGIIVLQVITIKEGYFDFYRTHPDFIQKYIFPGGMLPTAEIISREAERAGLELQHEERFGDSYARTISDWAQRFQKAWPTIQTLGFDMRFKRMWDYYLAYCQAGFETGIIDVGLYKFSLKDGSCDSARPVAKHP